MAGGDGRWSDSKSLARAMLRDRVARRKVMERMLILALLLMAAGLWWVDGLLAQSPWWFLMWWGGCAADTIGVLGLAVYDVLAVWREERDKQR